MQISGIAFGNHATDPQALEEVCSLHDSLPVLCLITATEGRNC